MTSKCLALDPVSQARCVFETVTDKFPRKGQTLLRQILDGTAAAEIQTLLNELAKEMAPVDDEKICAELATAPGTARAACIDHHHNTVQSLMRIRSLVTDLWVAARSQKDGRLQLANYTNKELKAIELAHPKGSKAGQVLSEAPASK